MFWNEGKEPLRQYRWVMEFDGKLAGMRYALKKASRPTMKISEVTHKYLNHFYYYPGRLEWDPISVTFASTVTANDAALGDSTLIDALITAGYIYPTKDNEWGTISKANAIAQLTSGTTSTPEAPASAAGGKSIGLKLLDAGGTAIETWYLWNCLFTEVKFDSLDYSAEDILNIDVTIKYDYATLDDAAGQTLVSDGK
jgi:hypothetical protein